MNTKKLFSLIPILFLTGIIQLSAQPTVLISYYSKTGNTKQMAEAVARGAAKVEGINVVLSVVVINGYVKFQK